MEVDRVKAAQPDRTSLTLGVAAWGCAHDDETPPRSARCYLWIARNEITDSSTGG